MVNKTSTTVRKALLHSGELVATRLTRQEVEKLDALVEAGAFLNRSDALRTSVREMLTGVKVLNMRNLSLEDGRKRILAYLKEHDQAYPSDIANDLELDYDFVRKVLHDLRKSGEAEPA